MVRFEHVFVGVAGLRLCLHDLQLNTRNLHPRVLSALAEFERHKIHLVYIGLPHRTGDPIEEHIVQQRGYYSACLAYGT